MKNQYRQGDAGNPPHTCVPASTLHEWKARAEKAEVANKRYEARAWQDGGDIDRLMRERDALRAEVERLATLVADMWLNADNWSGPNASSHYRSDISLRVRGALNPGKDGEK